MDTFNMLDLMEMSNSKQVKLNDTIDIDDILNGFGDEDIIPSKKDNADTKGLDNGKEKSNLQQEDIKSSTNEGVNTDNKDDDVKKDKVDEKNDKKVDDENNSKTKEQQDNKTEDKNDESDISSEIDDLDKIIDNVIKNDNINLDLIRELEKAKISISELETKYNALKEKYQNLLEEKLALESGDNLSEIPPKLKGIVRIYGQYEAGDENVKQSLIDSLAGLLTDLTGKDFYKYLDTNSGNDISALAETEGVSASSKGDSKQHINTDTYDPEVLDVFGVDL